MGKADKIKLSKASRNESLDQQIHRTEYAQSKGRVKVNLIILYLFLNIMLYYTTMACNLNS